MTVSVSAALSDARAYAKQHPAVEAAEKAVAAALEELERVSAKALERALLVLIGEIPVVGSILETIAAPLFDVAEGKVADAAVAATNAEATKIEGG